MHLGEVHRPRELLYQKRRYQNGTGKHWKDTRKYEAFVKMLGLRGTIFVLQFLDENKTAKYSQLQSISMTTP
jgi:hypothetical protein